MNKHIEEKLDQLLELVIESSSEAQGRKKRLNIKEYTNNLINNLRQVQLEAAAKTKEAAIAVYAHAQKKPWIYVATATAAGLILGLLLRRRR